VISGDRSQRRNVIGAAAPSTIRRAIVRHRRPPADRGTAIAALGGPQGHVPRDTATEGVTERGARGGTTGLTRCSSAAVTVALMHQQGIFALWR
jgi:hypothetical protein